MKKIDSLIIAILAVLFLASIIDAQSRTNRLWRPCPTTAIYPAKVEIETNGNINLIPCFTGSGSIGKVSIGDTTGIANGTGLTIDDAANEIRIDGTQYITGMTVMGVAGDIYLETNAFNDTFDFQSLNFGTVDFDNISNLKLRRSITAGGTTGNQTINFPVGTVNFAAGTGTGGITVTNSTASATSLIFCTVQNNDATATSCRITDKGAGTFAVRLNANATAETSVAFWVTN